MLVPNGHCTRDLTVETWPKGSGVTFWVVKGRVEPVVARGSCFVTPLGRRSSMKKVTFLVVQRMGADHSGLAELGAKAYLAGASWISSLGRRKPLAALSS